MLCKAVKYKPVKLYVHKENPNICPAQTIKHLDKRNNNVAHETTMFFFAHGQSFKAAHEDTISRWVKEIIAEAGIDVSKYNTHSCRLATTTGVL